jgi:hypothetical protein
MDNHGIRAGRLDELPTVQEIERRAARRLASVGLPSAADLPIHPMEELRFACSHGRLLVAADQEDRAVGFALFDLYGSASLSLHGEHEHPRILPRAAVDVGGHGLR